MDELTQCHAIVLNKRLMIKVSWMAVCPEGLGQMGRGPWDCGTEDLTKPTQMGRTEGKVGKGLAALRGPILPCVEFPVEVGLAAALIFSSCLILFSNSVIKTEHVMDALCYLKALKSIAEVIRRNSLSSQSYLRQRRCFIGVKPDKHHHRQMEETQ